MIYLYIIFGIVFMALAIFLLDYREKMTKNIKLIKDYKNEIDHLNEQLDDIQETLNAMNEPLSKIAEVSQKILKRIGK